MRELNCKELAAVDCCNSFHDVGLLTLGLLTLGQQMGKGDDCCSGSYSLMRLDLQVNGVYNAVVAVVVMSS